MIVWLQPCYRKGDLPIVTNQFPWTKSYQWNRNPRPQLEPRMISLEKDEINWFSLETPVCWIFGVGLGGSVPIPSVRKLGRDHREEDVGEERRPAGSCFYVFDLFVIIVVCVSWLWFICCSYLLWRPAGNPKRGIRPPIAGNYSTLIPPKGEKERDQWKRHDPMLSVSLLLYVCSLPGRPLEGERRTEGLRQGEELLDVLRLTVLRWYS